MAPTLSTNSTLFNKEGPALGTKRQLSFMFNEPQDGPIAERPGAIIPDVRSQS